jgi:hypothetical protein
MDVEHIECSITGCRSVPHCDCRWGTGNLPVQAATFCKEHADELWRAIDPLLKMNMAWYEIAYPGTIVCLE